MGFVRDVVGGIFGSGADAAKDAANVQAASADRAIASSEKAQAQAREDLTPFRDVGTTNLSDLGQLVTNPEAQKKFIEENPFFNALADKNQQNILSNAAAKGKVGSGGTAEALQNSLLLLGSDLLNQSITQRQNLASLGSNAAAGQANATLQTSNTISDLITQKGNVQAAGIIGKRNAEVGALNNTLNTSAVALCDVRAKRDIEHVGYLINGIPIYSFKYMDSDEIHINVMAQDVEQVMPEAVIEHNGVKYVYMEKITCH